MTVIVFFAAIALLYGIWCVAIRFGLKDLSCTRSFSRPAAFMGEEIEVIEVVRNDKPTIIPWLMVESRISPYLRFGRQDNLHVSGEMHYCSQFTLMPYQQIRRRHRVRFLHRGEYNLGNASLTAGDLLGFSRWQRTQDLDAPLLVYPSLYADEELPIPMSRMLGELTRRPQLLQDPFLVRGIRPYMPGDPVRDIHWPATARTGEAQVRVHDYSARTKLLVILNVQKQEIQWHDHISEEDAEFVERAISLAATVCVRALRDGLAVGFAANMPVSEVKESTVLLPAEGAAREEELLATFARLKVLRSQHFPAFLADLAGLTGMDMVIMSPYDSDAIQTAMEELRRNGNQVHFHRYQGGRV